MFGHLEQLETRRMFASVWNPSFWNYGNDTIKLSTSGDRVTVTINGTSYWRRTSDVSAVFISAGLGNDSVKCDSNFPVKVILHGGAGHDTLFGGLRGDEITGGGSNDWVMAGGGNDTVHGDHGNDIINGEAGIDVITGGSGNDMIQGMGESDFIAGEFGNDTIYGHTGSDWINGGPGNDVLYGDAGDDRLWGGDGNDALTGGEGRDELTGGNGSDAFYAKDYTQDKLYLGGDVADWFVQTDTFDLVSQAASSGGVI